MNLSQLQVCIFCGCFDLIACAGGCSWLSRHVCDRCIHRKMPAPRNRTLARRILALWFTELAEQRPVNGGRHKGLALVSVPIRPRHRTLVIAQLKAWDIGRTATVKEQLQGRIAFNRRARRWEIVGPWEHLIMAVGAAQHALHGWEVDR